ncbi:MAG: hypothetical protein CMA59_01430, partial [Euryarchaeota archaeon]|nr:hypothetical protein [Euryarchaeota archaeon]
TLPCTGDNSKFCGGKSKESVYQMHDCNAAAYVPTDPNEAMNLVTELTANGVKFFVKDRDLEVRGTAGNNTDISTDYSGLKKGLALALVDPHNGRLMMEKTFLIDGLKPGRGSFQHEVLVAHQEAAAMRRWVSKNTLMNYIVMIGAHPDAFNYATLQWGADVEEALKEMGCPQWGKPPKKGQGYAAVCSGHASGFQSETIIPGHVAVYGPVGTMADTLAYYMIDCKVSKWENVGECSRSCGGGLQAQNRHVEIEPAHGGQICPEAYDRYVPCNEDPCPVDCGYSQWTGFGPCDASCGPGTHFRTRSILNYALYGGVPCNEQESNLLQTQACQIVPCPIHAEWNEWADWGQCSEFCGPGEELRTRDRKVVAQWGGRDVEGPFEELRGCFLKHCPVDCEVSEWEDSGSCSLSCGTGQQKQVREITTHAAHGGAECPTDMEQFLPCNENPCPIDCVVADWINDGGCSLTCGTGKQLQYRYIKVPTQHGGVPCPRTMEQFINCNTDPCPVDCVWSQWGGWRHCDHDCGPGMQERHRWEEVESLHGGVQCLGPDVQDRECEVMPCPVQCEWAEWSQWTECSEECGPGRQSRERLIEVHAQWGGNPCDGAPNEDRDCEKVPCPVDCEVSDWADEGVCDRQCGSGLLLQTRRITTDAAHGGSCPSDMERHVSCNTHPCPVQCEMANWQDNGDCSVTCGGGIMNQVRSVIQHAQYGAEACPTDMEREVPCNDQECPVDCVWTQWSGWSACSTYCGPGVATRTRRIETPSAFGGVECVGVDYEEMDCQARECPIDCEWAEWGQWGTCSDECGPGVHYRNRDIEIEAQHGGDGCQGFGQEEQACQIVACPIDCEVSPWEKSGDCSLSCGGGLQTFVRSVTVDAAHGGSACPDDMSKQEPCNSWDCPIDCVVSDWLDDGECSTSCGGGLQAQIKNVIQETAFGGALCPSQMNKHVPCNEDACPVDCMWDAWTGWTTCSASCGEGTEERSRVEFISALHGGSACEGDAQQTRDCEIVPCPIDCVWEDWTGWSVCSESCGPGSRERSRGVSVHNMYGGAACEGKSLESEDCEVEPCPVDCEITEWGVVADCDASCGGGGRLERREITVNSDHGGEACPSDLERTVPCNEDPCPIDCVLASWTNDGTCTQECGGGVQHQVKAIIVAPQFNGASCHPDQERWIACNEQPCAVNCEWTAFSGWSPCSSACGDGTSERTRTVAVYAAHGGVECSGESREMQDCTSVPCPIDGVWGEWSDWGTCDEQCGVGQHFRTRSPETAHAYGGVPVEGPATEYQECQDKPCPIDCEVSGWSVASGASCSVSCGGGVIEETRSVTTEAAHEGEACPTEMSRDMPCNELPCPVDCELSDWAAISSCSVTCGGGTYIDERQILVAPANNGVTCEAPLQRFVDCNTDECPVDCMWGSWSGFSTCSMSCGPGTEERTRAVQVEAAHDGVACEGPEAETRDCELQSCPIDCVWGEWQEWTECTEQCGPGETKRGRAIETPAQFGGATCDGAFYETEECEVEPCPVDCSVSDWANAGECSVSCGGGTRPEERTIHTPAQFNGVECPTDLVRDVACNPEECPVDCEMSDWIDDGSCTVTCGGGAQRKVRTVVVSAAHGGEACPTDLNKTVDCGDDPCPVNCVWGEWSGWPVCSEECGTGERTRDRSEAVSAAHGGEACTGANSETESCNENPCPINCEWEDWGGWGPCNEVCGPGLQDRERYHAVTKQFGGLECTGAFTEQQACEDVPCAIDCVMSSWTKSEEGCSKTCGGGKIKETRTVETAGDHGGVTCPETDPNGVEERLVDCNTDNCPVDCELEDWVEDGSCSHSCGGGEQVFRKAIRVAHAHGGAECPAADSPDRLKREECAMDACPVDCVVSEWSGWSACSESCGKGSRTKSREVQTDAADGGVACPHDLDDSEECLLVQCPVDCAFASWGEWGECSSECGPGTKLRSRTSTPAEHGGAACEGAHEEETDCEVTPCPVDCELGAWEDAGDCSEPCGGGDLKQTRAVNTAAEHGGEECGATEQTLPCNPDPCPIDCELDDWVEDGSCSKSCGGGEQHYKKAIRTTAAHGGSECPAADSADRAKTEACNDAACPVDCVVTEWSGWGECSTTCGDGESQRTREITTEAADGGAECEGELSETQTCKITECPVDCVAGEWTAWSACTATCGEASSGSQERTREVQSPEQHGGADCGSLHESRDECPDIPACPIDCVVGEWEDAGSCSVTCGGDGTLEQTRSVQTEAAHNGTSCPSLTNTVPCGDTPCPVDCVLSDWTASGTCTRQCGGGVRYFQKFVEIEGEHGGEECPGAEDLNKHEPCNDHACPGSPEGEVGAALMSLGNGGGSKTVTLNVQYPSQPVVVVGPVPKRGDNEGRVVVASVAKRETEVAPPLDEEPSVHNEACKCTGGPSNVVTMGEGNIQYPASYGNFCFEWAPRDVSAAEAAAEGVPELVYLGEGWAYNTVTKMRVQISGEVPLDNQVVGQNVELPEGSEGLPDFPAEDGVAWPVDGAQWCYVAESGCASASSDGWAKWVYCNHGDHQGEGWDNRPAVGYPEAKVCPLAGYTGASPTLFLLTRKSSTHMNDICVGKDELNECHDGSGLGGFPLGLLSSVRFTDDMVMLQRAYNAEAKDTCVFPSGEKDKYCKSSHGQYGEAVDIGYAFTTEKLGTVAAKASFNSDKQDSCFAIDGGSDGCGEGETEDLGTMVYILDEAAWDAWAQCGAQATTDEKWLVTLELEVTGEVADGDSNTERVPWMAMKQGSFTTSDGKMIQAGIALVEAGADFPAVKFHEAFASAPVVVANSISSLEAVAGDLAIASYAGDATDEDYPEWYASKSSTDLTDGVVIDQWSEAESFKGLSWTTDANITFDLQATSDITEVTIGYGVRSDWERHAPSKVKVYCSMDGSEWSFLSEGTDFSGVEFHNDAHVPASGKCLKVLLAFTYNRNGGGFVLDEVTIKGTAHVSSIRMREPTDSEFYVKADGEGIVAVHWIAVEKTHGYLSSYPFVAGELDNVDPEGKDLTWSDEGHGDRTFTQIPLVFASVATDRTPGEVDLRVNENSPTDLTLSLEGSSAAEKVSYFVYNGQGYTGAVVKTTPNVLISYEYAVGGWSDCEAPEGETWGERTRTVDCQASTGTSMADVYCPGARPAATEACAVASFSIMSYHTGRCLKEKDENAPANNKQLKWKHECTGANFNFRTLPAGGNKVYLQNRATGKCLGAKGKVETGKKIVYKNDCSGAKQKFIIEKNSDGSVFIKSGKDDSFCLSTDGPKAELGDKIDWSASAAKCSEGTGDKNKFMLVDGSMDGAEIESYDIVAGQAAGTEWYVDTGLKLIDGSINPKKNWGNAETHKGVGFIRDEVDVQFKLKAASPLAVVTVGWNWREGWNVLAPEWIKVSCSADGSGWGSEVQHSKDHLMAHRTKKASMALFNVKEVCGDDTQYIRVQLKPQATPEGTEDADANKAIIDEVDVYRPAPDIF